MKNWRSFLMSGLVIFVAASAYAQYPALMVRPLQLQFPDPLQQAQQIEQIRALRIQNEQAEAQRRYMEEQQAQERQRRQVEAARPQQSQPNNQPDPVFDEWLKAAAPRMSLYKDFEKVVFAPDVAITTDMIRLMTTSPLAADIAYYLGSNKIESLAISKMSLVEAARNIDRIESKLKASTLP